MEGEVKFCQYCGKQIDTGTVYCIHCGNKTDFAKETKTKKKSILNNNLYYYGTVVGLCLAIIVLIIVGARMLTKNTISNKSEKDYVETAELDDDKKVNEDSLDEIEANNDVVEGHNSDIVLSEEKIVMEESETYTEESSAIIDDVETDFETDLSNNLSSDVYYDFDNNIGIYSIKVTAPDGYVNFREGNSTSTRIISEIRNGDVLSVIRDEGKWLYVTWDGMEGWVATSQVSRLDSFYGIWCAASKNMNDARTARNLLQSAGYEAEILMSSDWENLNKEPYYVVTAGVYDTEQAASSRLAEIQTLYGSAYIKYSGKHK